MLSPVTFFLLVVNIVYAFFETFAIVDTATGGGPGQATEILVYKVYKDGFKALDLGSSAAQSVILMAIVVTLTVIQFRFIERKVLTRQETGTVTEVSGVAFPLAAHQPAGALSVIE